MSRSSWVATLFRCPPLLPHFHPYGLETTTRASPPPFSTSGNLVVKSVSPSDFTIAVKAAPMPPCLFSPSHRRCDRHDDPQTVHLDIQYGHPLGEHTYHALP
ncbi:hypothetical protein ARMGADRAFT_1079894 [Armillaria gallica]|uniref:Uncharacterized protein n=1 Tax=Armillaria gallica TaxID=47427 RepID=A0A2H3DEE6_ARMGA|nr:hypothetical protein ARMGADRAFT_1079894 [Armillaria gallica]